MRSLPLESWPCADREAWQLTRGAVELAIAQMTDMTLGIRMRPHDFRRCAAATEAFRAGDMPHLASGVLQHRDRQVTDEHYNRTSSMQASMQFGEMIAKIRSNPKRRLPVYALTG
jgi:integrase